MHRTLKRYLHEPRKEASGEQNIEKRKMNYWWREELEDFRNKELYNN